MDEKGVSGSFMVISEENIDSLYPMLFSVSCAFFALRLLPEPEICDDDNKKWLEIRNRMLKGSAHLLGLLVWRVQREAVNIEKIDLLQKLDYAQKEMMELKKTRSEDAKANERVVSIFASREQSWFDERKKLTQQIAALMNDLRVLETKHEKSVSELSEKLKETEFMSHSKDKMIEEEEKKRRDAEEKLKKAENLVEELRESVKNEISKHKSAFIELVSNQRQLEAEMSRAVKQFQATKDELDTVLEQNEELVLGNRRLSMELVKMHKDLEQKNQILSAMLRKSKLDTAEKQTLLKEVKSSKAKRKQAELETARWKAVSESKHERYSLRNMLSKHVRKAEHPPVYEQPQIRKGLEVFSIVSDPYSTDGPEKPQLAGDVEHLENWINSEAEKYKIAEERHHLEVDAFAQQLRLKDEKLEVLRWRLMSTELESKRLQLHIERLDHGIAQLSQENIKLKSVLLNRDAELHSLKEQLIMHLSPPNPLKSNSNHDTLWSQVKVIKRKPGHARQEMKAIAEEISKAVENDKIDEQLQDIVLTLQSPNGSPEDAANCETSASAGQESSKRSDCTWKMDIQALGVLYKVKRLKQQLIMLERLTGKKESCENNNGVKGPYSLMSLLDKQVDRYQSLLGKIDDLCKRMHECNLNLKSIAEPEDKTTRLERFLEETFQLQRYMVATGQKLIEVQAKIASAFSGDLQDIENPANFDMKRFADGLKTLFREVQRGLEVRISRIIGYLEGTLACDGFHTS